MGWMLLFLRNDRTRHLLLMGRYCIIFLLYGKVFPRLEYMTRKGGGTLRFFLPVQEGMHCAGLDETAEENMAAGYLYTSFFYGHIGLILYLYGKKQGT